jgi:hypothetical protein
MSTKKRTHLRLVTGTGAFTGGLPEKATAAAILEKITAARADLERHLAAFDELVEAQGDHERGDFRCELVHTYLQDAFACLSSPECEVFSVLKDLSRQERSSDGTDP